MANQIARVTAKSTGYKSLKVNVHKFGGSSIKTATQIKRISHLIRNITKAGDIIVVSANGKVTDWLICISQGQEQYLAKIKEYLTILSNRLLNTIDSNSFALELDRDIQYIERNQLRRSLSYHKLLSFGEKWSISLFSKQLKSLEIRTKSINPVEVLRLNNEYEYNQFDREFADNYLSKLYSDFKDCIFLIGGFVASDVNSNVITLGRNGSDYSATTLAQFANAKSVTIWTDVDGIYSADPNLIKNTVKAECLSLCEAQSLSELGANVLHEKTISPLLNRETELFVKSSFIESSIGTRIQKTSPSIQKVKTVTIKKKLSKVIVPNISEFCARKIQQKLISKQISTFANTYDKSLEKVIFYVDKDTLFNAVSIVKSSQFFPTVDQTELALISLVGQDIRQDREVIGKFLTRLERFDVKNIHYPSNSHTLCVFVDEKESEQLLKDLHDTFFNLEPSIPIVVLGYGNIGKQFVEILTDNIEKIEALVKRSLSLVGISNSRHFVFGDGCLSNRGNQLFEDLNCNKSNQLINQLAPYINKELVIVDLTASDEIANSYEQFAKNKWHIISANKIAASNPTLANLVNQEQAKHNRRWLKNTTAGAGLPVQSSIIKLQESGDLVEKISGIFSGSISWLFGQYDGSTPFTELLEIAKKNAFTEPDPREDLSGNDVIRKIRILAKEAGFDDAREDFSPAIDACFLQGDLDDFWEHEELINEYYYDLYQRSQSEGGVLRYIATLTKDLLKLKLEVISPEHAFANLNPCDNIFSLETGWYKDNPLIIQGPGAGREVTAAGVLNDLCDLLRGV